MKGHGGLKGRFTLNLLWQSMHRCVPRSGLFRDITCGQPRGCPLSPLLGAFFLAELDNALEDKGVFYVRYVNAVLVITPGDQAAKRYFERTETVKKGSDPPLFLLFQSFQSWLSPGIC